MNNLINDKKILRFIAGASVLCLAIGVFIGMHLSQTQKEHDHSQSTDNAEILYWYDPMYPTQHFDKPGKSPFMDMDLVPKYATEKNITESNHVQDKSIYIDQAIIQQLGWRTATVERRLLSEELKVTGTVAFNERDLIKIQSLASGYVEKIWPLAKGDAIKKGQALFSLVIPEWINAQQELLLFISTNQTDLIMSAREKLTLLGMPEDQINRVMQSKKILKATSIHAPQDGVIQDIELRAGMAVNMGQPLVSIYGTDSYWLIVWIPEAQATAIALGDRVTINFSRQSLANIEGKVSDILPALDEVTRRAQARIEIANSQLKPGMSGLALLQLGTKEKVIAIPTEAIIHTREMKVAMISAGEGRFYPQEIITGRQFNQYTEIITGVNEGQEVVVSGQFLLDSEAQLQNIKALPATPTHDHNQNQNQNQDQIQNRDQEHDGHHETKELTP